MKIKEKRNLWKYDNFVIKIEPDPDYYMANILELNNKIYNKLTLKGIDLNKRSHFISSTHRYRSYINPTSGWDLLFLPEFIGDRDRFMNDILGYNDSGYGTFPYVEDINDAIILTNAAIKRILQI